MNIQTEKNAKAYAQEEIEIKVPIEKAYNILSNIPDWPKWQSNIKEATVAGKISEGSVFVWKTGGLKITSKLHTVKPVLEFGWTGTIGWIKAVHNWYFERINNGTRVKVEESMTGFGASLMKRTLKKGMIQNLQELKKFAEAGNKRLTVTKTIR